MPFKKGESGNPVGRPKGSLNKTTQEIREQITQAIDTNKICEMLNQITSPLDYINAINLLFMLSNIKMNTYWFYVRSFKVGRFYFSYSVGE